MDDIENKYKMYVNAYLGIELMDEYELKPYILEELKEYIKDFKNSNEIDIDFKKTYNEFENNPSITKLQDALYTINELNGPIDLIHLIELRLKRQKDN